MPFDILLTNKLESSMDKDMTEIIDLSSIKDELDFSNILADFIELGELMIRDALDRNESCGGHFREEYQTPEGEALRDDENYTFVSAWEYRGENKNPVRHKEDLKYDVVKPTQRSYK